jgi:hypothetical protein
LQAGNDQDFIQGEEGSGQVLVLGEAKNILAETSFAARRQILTTGM